MRKYQRQVGFTLLEVMLAILLLGLLVAGAYGGITASVRAMRSGEAAIERIDKVRTVQEFLRRQISRTLPLPFAQDGAALIVFEGSSNSIRFVAPMPGYLSHGGAYVQTLQLAPGDDGQRLVFSSTLLNGFSSDKTVDESATVVLLEHIHDGKFSFRGVDQQGNLLSWTDGWNDPTKTPLLVGIDIGLSGAQIGWPAMIVPLMMDSTAVKQAGMGLPGAQGLPQRR